MSDSIPQVVDSDYLRRVSLIELAIESQIPVGAVHVARELCTRCGFVVTMQGHEARCRIPQSAQALELYRRRAWFGDVWQTYHVRFILMRCGLSLKDLQSVSEQYVGAVGQTTFYETFTGRKLVALGKSSHSISTAFEASYYLFREFRFSYLQYLCTDLSCNVPLGDLNHLADMFLQDEFFPELQLVSTDVILEC